ncbi:MAG: SDR family NAD(P)-dependent oxidoreductase [Comamonadaceae bacterium]|nr:SDR family NAD(P)-dependent oxidoreductase [Comamonadaceae bacterium]
MSRLLIVAGGAKGIGAAIGALLAQQGYRLAIADIDTDNAIRTAQSLGVGHAAYHVDVSDEASVSGLFDAVQRQQGRISGLVCAAGLLILPNGQRPLIEALELQDWERSFAVNTRGAFLCSRAFLRHFSALPSAHGRVVFLGSVAAQLGGYRSSAAYIAAKAGLMGYAKAYAREVAHLGITANCIAPGLIDTDMLRSTIASSGDLDRAASSIPLGRIGSVEDVAAAAAYLVSEEAGYLTGSVIDVNGGYRMQ